MRNRDRVGSRPAARPAKAAKPSAAGASGTQGSKLASWRFGLLASAVGHVCVLLGLFAAGKRAPTVAEMPVDPGPVTIAVTPIEALADLDSPPPVPPEAQELDDPKLPYARPWDALPGERDHSVAVTIAPAEADGRVRVAPAPDQGDAGAERPVRAFRRDRSELHSRLSDSADEAQPARTKTSRRASSPQAIRREVLVGLGDSPRTVAPKRAPDPARAGPIEAAPGRDPQGTAPRDVARSESEEPPSAAELALAAVLAHAVGPLEADAGKRSFDNERPGPATDNQTMRGASNELHPGRTDFSRPTALTNAGDTPGAGPGTAPGAVSHPSAGTAPQALGARQPAALGPQVSERTLDRRYDRYLLEIQQRVNRIREFPKALALRLEQGETIVRFVVGIDGRLGEEPYVVKSSGFDEFDGAALRAVRRAAPFPPMPDPMTARPQAFSLRVMFDNPVVR
jgi:TonB family protein